MSRLITTSCVHINAKGNWCNDEDDSSPRVGDVIRHRVSKTFADVGLYYANLIDYARILMALAALGGVFLAQKEHHSSSGCHIVEWIIGALIFGSVLLDAVDGKVARYFQQSSVMGCGWDWLADIFAQYCLAVWCATSPNVDARLAVFVVFFSLVEIACGLFDFAISAQAVYPSVKDTSIMPW